MLDRNTIAAEQLSFKSFLFLIPRNKYTLVFAAIAIVIQFVIFKYFYPFASYIHGDSFSYINAAENNLTLNTYLVGYSKFLRLISIFAKPDIVLVAIQYLMIEFSVLFLLFTIFYFYKAGRYMQTLLLIFMVFNPLFLHLGNLVSSDGLFLAISMIWFALLIWITHRPSNSIIIWHAVVLFIAFTVRYNAMIYPIISGVAFFLSNFPLRKKVLGISISLTLCGFFVWFTMFQYKKLTGIWQYSPFSGWQLANNAMYAYRYVDSANRKFVSKDFQALDNMIRVFFDSTRNTKLFPTEEAMASTFYMWSPGMPLMEYKNRVFEKQKDSISKELKKWATMGPLYKNYGIYIIKKYPWHFIKYFVFPNSRKYYAPPIEFLDEYNSGRSYVIDQAKNWFGYTSTKIKTRFLNQKVIVLEFYPILSGIVNVLMLIGLIYYILLKGWQHNIYFNKVCILAGTVWILNAGFTIFASSAALRFQSFPVLLTTIFSMLLVDWMIQLTFKMKEAETNNIYNQLSTLDSIANVNH